MGYATGEALGIEGAPQALGSAYSAIPTALGEALSGGAAVGAKQIPKLAERSKALAKSSITDAMNGVKKLDGSRSVGAQQTPMELQRAATAQSMPVPFEGESALTKGQVTRNFEQLQFEKEMAKRGDTGEPFRDRVENQSQTLVANLDALAELPQPFLSEYRDIGKSVDTALKSRVAKEKKKVDGLYDKARAAGELQDSVKIESLPELMDTLQDMEDVAKNAVAVQKYMKKRGFIGEGVEDLSDYDTSNIFTHAGDLSGGIDRGGVFDGIFASYGDRSSGGVNLSNDQSTFIARKNKIAESGDSSFDYGESVAFLKDEFPDESDEFYDTLYEWVAEDKSNPWDDNILDGHGFDDAGEASWEAQRLRGQLAAKQGFDAVEMDDETGTSLLIPYQSKAKNVADLSSGNEEGVSPMPKTLEETEKLRSYVNKVTDLSDPQQSRVRRIILSAIDDATENAGGDIFKEARKARAAMGREFENVGITKRLLATKKGTDERSIAYEDVFKKVLLDSPIEEINKLRGTLLKSGAGGKQAWTDLKAKGIEFIKENAQSASQADSKGNPLLSTDKLNKVIASMDEGGKLEGLYGKRGAQVLRDLGDLARDIHTAPPGAINHSNTASALAVALDSMGGFLVTGVPAPVISTLKGVTKYVKSNKTKKQIEHSLNYLERQNKGKTKTNAKRDQNTI